MSQGPPKTRPPVPRKSDASVTRLLIGAAIGATVWLLIGRLLLFELLGKVVLKTPDVMYVRFASDPINLGSFVGFAAAIALLLGRAKTTKRERNAFASDLLQGDPQTLILPDDARRMRQRLNSMPDHKLFLVFRFLSVALQRARANWSTEDVSAALQHEVELAQAKIESQYSMIRYLAWAIPSIGFVGTVVGISKAMAAIGGEGDALKAASEALGVAFDTTFVALMLSLVLMYLLHKIQADEDSSIVEAVELCMNQFVHRMHITKEV